ncbi:unnamed protein product [Wickerhamomyces anomalus]
MSTSGQFPPSSPFLDHHQEEDADPFSSKTSTNVTNQSKKFVINTPFNKDNSKTYPTPNPSSSTGVRSSSPARQNATITNNTEIVQTPDRASSPQESTFLGSENVEYKDPLNDVLRAKITSNHTTTLGRSSRCDYFVKSKFASRVHLKLQYDSERNELSILFSNHLFYFQKIEEFEIKSDDEIFHDISLFRGEQITVPYMDSLTLEIKDHVTVLDVCNDDSETEDELPVLNTRFSSVEPGKIEQVERINVTAVESGEVKEVEEKSVKDVEGNPIEKVDEAKAEETESKSIEKTPVEVKPVEVKSDEVNSRSTTKKSNQPLQPKSESSLNKIPQSRRRKAEPGISPQKKKPLIKHLQPRDKISQLNIKEIVSTVEDLASVENVLINHLAFSRTSQTPLYTLQTVSAITQNLSRTQLRAVLFQIQSIGTIYRKGKDAAGKPLDEEYYYDVEKDDDLERTKLVSSIKGASGLRNCRKTHKQYFWKKPTK